MFTLPKKQFTNQKKPTQQQNTQTIKFNKIHDELERFAAAVSQGHLLHKCYTTDCRPANPLGTIAYILRNTHGNCDGIQNMYIIKLGDFCVFSLRQVKRVDWIMIYYGVLKLYRL